MAVQKTSTLDFTYGNIWKEIFQYSWPLLLGNLFQQCYNAADSLIVGNILGARALACVSSSGTLTYMMVGFFNGVALGAGVVIAKYFGARDYNTMSKAIHVNIAFGLVSGVFLTILGVSLTPAILRLMKTPSDIMEDSISYFKIYSMGILFCVMYNNCMGIMHATGDSTHPLYYLIISSVANVVLDFLFVAYFDFGVGGAAAATTIGQGLSFVLCFIRLLRTNEVYKVKIKDIHFDLRLLKEILINGLPSGIQNSVIGIANVFVQSQVNTFSSIAVAGSGAYAKIESFSFIPTGAFSSAMSTCVSQNLGADKVERAKKGAFIGLTCCVLLSEFVGVVLFVFAPALIGLFNGDLGVIEMGVMTTRIRSLFFCCLAFSHGVAGIMRGAGRSYVPMFVMLGFWCILRVLYIAVATPVWHSFATVCWAYPLTWGCSTIVFIIYLLKMDWHKIKLNEVRV